jgi:hypothetical protein
VKQPLFAGRCGTVFALSLSLSLSLYEFAFLKFPKKNLSPGDDMREFFALFASAYPLFFKIFKNRGSVCASLQITENR